jgi:hypothetical protein
VNIYRLFSAFLLLLIQSCAQNELLPTNSANLPSERVITAQGQARISQGEILLARKSAFKNAMKNAALQAGNTFSPETLIGSTKVVDEWVTDDTYHLQVLSVLSKEKHCNSPYRKRILATGFPIVTSGQVNGNETQDLYAGIPREMLNIMLETGDFIGRNKTHTTLYSRPDMAPEIITQADYQDSMVVQLAEEYNSQFVLSGVIRDLEVESTKYVRGAGYLAQAKSLMRDFIARRGVAIDIYIHDGANGALLFQNRYTDTVVGDVWIPTGYTVGSERFKATPSGHKISKIIKLASQDIRRLIGCHPFSAKIISIKNNKVFIAAGAQDKLKTGDSLVVYSHNLNAGMQYNELIGVIIIENVQAGFSIGKMEITSLSRKIKTGDLVKSW